jgi:hypothetical protein
MMGNIAIETHEGMMAKNEKRVSVYQKDLEKELALIREVLEEQGNELAEIASKMTPPYPFEGIDSLESVHFMPKKNVYVVRAALVQTLRNIDSITASQWTQLFDEYISIASGKRSTRGGAEDVQYTEKMIEISDSIARAIEPIALDYRAKNGKTGMSYLFMSGKTSHKIIACLVILYTARLIESLKAEESQIS